jgi:hypothetical protein
MSGGYRPFLKSLLPFLSFVIKNAVMQLPFDGVFLSCDIHRACHVHTWFRGACERAASPARFVRVNTSPFINLPWYARIYMNYSNLSPSESNKPGMHNGEYSSDR